MADSNSIQCTDDVDDPEQTAEAAPKPRRRWWLYLLVGIAVLPSVLTVTGSASRLLSLVHPKLARVTRFNELTLHWWAPVECRNLRTQACDETGADSPAMLVVPVTRTSEPLWRIAYQLGRGIHVTLERPELNLMTTETGTNVTDAVTDLFGESPSDGPGFPIDLTIQDGQINLAEAVSETKVTETASAFEFSLRPLLSDVELHLSTLDPGALLPDVSLVALHGDASDSQSPAVRLNIGVSGDTGTRVVELDALRLDLQLLEPLTTGFLPGSHGKGLLTVHAKGHLLGETVDDGIAIRFTTRADDVHWRQDGWALGESLELETATAHGAIAIADDAVIVTDLRVECPIGRVTGNGEIQISANRLPVSIPDGRPGDAATSDADVSEAEAAAVGQVNLQGYLDIAALCRMLPRTLRLQDGVELQEAAVQFAARTQPTSRGNNTQTPPESNLDWQATVTSSPFVAQRDGNLIRWDSPLRIDASGPLSLKGADLRQIAVSGDFGRVDIVPQRLHMASARDHIPGAVGAPVAGDQWQVRGRLNVDQLWNGVGQFVQLPVSGIRGEITIAADVAMPTVGTIHLSGMEVAADNLQVSSERLVIRTDQPLMQVFDGRATLRGSGTTVGSLVAPWIDTSLLAKSSTVTLQIDSTPGDSLRLVADIQPGRVASRSPQSSSSASEFEINQGGVKLEIDADSRLGRFVIRDGVLQLPGLEAQVQGTLETHDRWMTTDLTVDVDYDLEQLSPLLFGRSDRSIHVTGRGRDRLIIRGAPAFWSGQAAEGVAPLEATGQLSWDSAEAYGLRLGAGRAAFRFANGNLRTEPIHCAINDGQLSAMVNYDVRRRHVALSAGCRAEKLTVTPALAAGWLGYITPLLADAAHMSGVISVRLSEFDYDLNRPQSSVMAGTVDVDGITASPGRSLAPLLQAVDALRPSRRSAVRDLTMPPQQIAFQLRDGTITHDNLHMSVAGYDVHSRGSVGLNQQIQMTLDVPIERSNEEQSGRTVRIPVSGTVRQPQIDIARLIRDTGTQQIQGRINNELDRFLDRLTGR